MQGQVSERTGFLFEEAWSDVDPESARITAFEEARQVNKLIMIASESVAPPAVRAALSSVFTDLYAEGYPAAHTTHESEALIGDIPHQIAYHERYSDRRYYKGTEFADLIEALAQNRLRHLFAPNRNSRHAVQIGPDEIQANVQPWSGANANTAVYLALLQPGDTILGLNLSHGGHLSHGSPANLSGKIYNVIPYGVSPETGRIDYDQVERLAHEHNPRMIVSGASAYPWDIDFARLRKICDSLPRRAYLLADVSHPAGLVVAGLFSNPVGIADVTTFTTHKTLIGPRAAAILTTNESIARRIDRAVFPGLQGGPHVNTIAALAVAFKIAQQPEFDELQKTIVANAQALAETLARRGLTIAYGGTETHLLLVDVRTIPQKSGVPLNGDVAARILDLGGVVCNKNTIAGDTSANFPSGIRLGTPWITQRGLTPDDMRTLGGIIADVLFAIETYPHIERNEVAARGKIAPEALKQAQASIADLIRRRTVGPPEPAGWPEKYCPPPEQIEGRKLIEIAGRRARAFLDEATSGNVWALDVGQAISVSLFDGAGRDLGTLGILRRSADEFGMDHFVVASDAGRYDDIVWWLDALSNGLVVFDQADLAAKVDGPVAVSPFAATLAEAEVAALQQALAVGPATPDLDKPYFVGQRALASQRPAISRPACTLPAGRAAPASPVPSRPGSAVGTAPAGWSMPMSYGDATAELKALHEAAGLIDETALGVLEISGPDAARFLDLLTTNDVAFLARNAAQYTFLLEPSGDVLSDALLYRIEPNRFLLTTAPSQSLKVKAWLDQASTGRCLIDATVPARSLPTAVSIQDLRETGGDTGRVVLGLVGPNAPAILRAIADTPEDRRKVGRIRRFTLTLARLAGASVIVSRTSHTGESQGYDIFTPIDKAEALWNAINERGAQHGVTLVGWEAFRTAGIAAGLPWINHELNGAAHISPIQAGYGRLIRFHKPFFVGRQALLSQPFPPPTDVVRFSVADISQGLPGLGDAIVDSSGGCVGWVTSRPFVAPTPIGLGLTFPAKAGARLSVLVGSGKAGQVRLGEAVKDSQTYASAPIEILSRFGK